MHKTKGELIEFGEKVVGPFLLGFCQYIYHISQKCHGDIILFGARDGYLPFIAFSKLSFSKQIKNDYFFVSRKSLRLPQLYLDCSIENVKSLLNTKGKRKVGSYFNMLGIYELLSGVEFDCETLNNICSVKEFCENKRIIQFFKYNENKIKEYAKVSYSNVITYLSQNGFKDRNVIFVDFGWRGTIQKSLTVLSKAAFDVENITGVYMCYDKAIKNVLPEKRFYGYVNELGNERLKAISSLGILLESIFMGDHGTTIRYEKIKETVQPVLDINIIEKSEILNEIQEGIMIYLKTSCCDNIFDYEPQIIEELSYPLYEFSVGKRDACLIKELGEIEVDMDNAVKNIIKYEKRINYINPIRLFQDLCDTEWKAGFFMLLFGSKNGYKFYNKLRSLK